MNPKYFPVNVLRQPQDCTMNGVTSANDILLLVAPWEGGEQCMDYMMPRLYLTRYMGELIAVPYDPGNNEVDHVNGYMFGGNFIWSIDSRFSSLIAHHPIKVFDRFEAQPDVLNFPRADLQNLRRAARLLQDVQHLLVTDSDLETVTASYKYTDMTRRINMILWHLGSSCANNSGILMADYHCECGESWFLPRSDHDEDRHLCPKCGAVLFAKKEKALKVRSAELQM